MLRSESIPVATYRPIYIRSVHGVLIAEHGDQNLIKINNLS